MKDIRIEDYDYHLPNDKIADFPLEKRDDSKLLVLKDNLIKESCFKFIDEYLPANSLLIFNNTKVIQARLVFLKETGARIELFCLESFDFKNFQLAFQQKGSVNWRCMVGNAKKWKEGKLSMKIIVDGVDVVLYAEMLRRERETFIVKFSWEPSELTFSEVLESSGNTPLPPYIKREVIDDDKTRYQTIYAEHKGSVAAPTAGLHFTDDVMKRISKKNIDKAYVSLHVGAGTFKPVSANKIEDHEMHTERIVVDIQTVEKLKSSGFVVPVGTTSVRTIESLYWFGVKLMNGEYSEGEMKVLQWDPYKERKVNNVSKQESMQAVIDWMKVNNLDVLQGSTQLMILPGYKYNFVDALITNFHQPKSTLLLLVSALIGDKWKEAYAFALQNNFRFLSYGDSCLFFNQK